jgi:hypothetical protein
MNVLALAAQHSGRGLSIGIFAAMLASTLGITFWASRRIHPP